MNAGLTESSAPRGGAWIDHIVVGVADLDAGVDGIESLTGARPGFGGEHPDLGTHNALLSLGVGCYLEILAPRPGARLAANLGFLDHLSVPAPVMWAVATDNVETTADLLRVHGHRTSDVTWGSRALPDGSRIRWKTLDLVEFDGVGAPFFIEWSVESTHPSHTAPLGCQLDSIELGHPQADRLRDVAQILGVQIAIEHRAESLLKIGMRCPNGLCRLGFPR